MNSLIAAFFTFALLPSCYGTYNLQLTNAVLAPDGYSRSTIVVNGQFPGPVITATKGQSLQINVEDQLTDTTMATLSTIHWHGLFQNGTNAEDGVASVTQCPIVPGNSFLYTFSTGAQAGTFWYHSHYSLQYCDGLKGPLIIYDPEDPYLSFYDVDNDATIITLTDWYHPPTSDLTIPAVSNTSLINGLGRYPGGPDSPLAVVNVTSGVRYRFRVINMACEGNFIFTIDSHSFTIIEADGVNTQPYEVDSIQIFAAQRYSLVLEANQPVGNYWIRAVPSVAISNSTADGLNSGILRYAGAPAEEPTSAQGASTSIFNEIYLHPLVSMPVPGVPELGAADVNLFFSFQAIGSYYTINNVQFIPPTVPVLLQILSGAQSAQDLLPAGSIYSLPRNKVVEVSIAPNVDALGGPHPFHLHGHNFWVIRSAGSTEYNYYNPIVRDTVSTGTAPDNITIRFVTNNPGPWFFHCHIDWHLQGGLAVVFAEDTENAIAVNNASITAAWDSLCPTYDDYTDS